MKFKTELFLRIVSPKAIQMITKTQNFIVFCRCTVEHDREGLGIGITTYNEPIFGIIDAQ